jgi:hypothetical protein
MKVELLYFDGCPSHERLPPETYVLATLTEANAKRHAADADRAA